MSRITRRGIPMDRPRIKGKSEGKTCVNESIGGVVERTWTCLCGLFLRPSQVARCRIERHHTTEG